MPIFKPFSFLMFLFFLATCESFDPEREALMSFFKSTSQTQPWKNSTGWLEPFVHQCEWFGITCQTTSQRVISINLSNNQLNGILPSGLQYLSDLKELNLSNNALQSISSEIGTINTLQSIDLSSNQIQILPLSLGNLTNLETLRVSSNRLTSLPESLRMLEYLSELDASFNNLEQFPPSTNLGEDEPFQNLKVLDLRFNSRLELTQSLWDLKTLEQLELSGISFSETLPSQIGQLTNLLNLELASCNLRQISTEIGQISSLQILDLESNQLTSLPWTQLNSLQGLKVLRLQGNANLATFQLQSTSLEALYLEGCSKIEDLDLNLTPNVSRLSFTGAKLPIPESLMWKFKFLFLSGVSEAPAYIDPSELQVLVFRNVKFDKWPENYANYTFPELWQFSIQESKEMNQSWCPFPVWLKNAPNLEQMFLVGNISGSLPTEIGKLSKLTLLSIAGSNSLTGTIPTEIGQLTALTDLLFNNLPSLTGPLPNTLANLVDTQDDNDEDGGGSLRSLNVDNTPSLDPNLDPALEKLSNLRSSCFLRLGAVNESFQCQTSSVLGGNICNIVCSSEQNIYGDWMNDDDDCKKVRPDSKLGTWNRTRLTFERMNSMIAFSSATSVGVGCSVGIIKYANYGFMKVYETVDISDGDIDSQDDHASSYRIRMKVGFNIVSRSITFLVQSGIVAARTVCPTLFRLGEYIPVGEEIDVTSRECYENNFEPFSFKPPAVCPEIFEILEFDFLKNQLVVTSNLPLFLMTKYCSTFPNETSSSSSSSSSSNQGQWPYLSRGWECKSDPSLTVEQECHPECGDGFLLGEPNYQSLKV